MSVWKNHISSEQQCFILLAIVRYGGTALHVVHRRIHEMFKKVLFSNKGIRIFTKFVKNFLLVLMIVAIALSQSAAQKN